MPKNIRTNLNAETAVLIGVISGKQTEQEVKEYLDELSFLTETAGGIPLKRFVQKLEHFESRTFIGSGKLNEIKRFVNDNNVEMVIFDDDLSPSQMRNIEDVLKCRVLDRTNLILDIFAKRAKTAYAKTQVELAQYQYLLTRLAGMWTHLSKQKGGIGLRGPGEKEIETDRRIIRDRISLLKEKLKIIDKQQITQRKSRGALVRVALVGYTNVGKSTIMNLLSKSDVFAENKLFATLDTTVRKVVIENIPFLLSDTVGFIRKLPHDLIESFKSTLDEVREADVLIHVVDVSHPCFEDQINIVKQTLIDIKVIDKPTLLVFNKIDIFEKSAKDFDYTDGSEMMTVKELNNTWMAKENIPCIFISATNKTNIDVLKRDLLKSVSEIHYKRYPNYLASR